MAATRCPKSRSWICGPSLPPATPGRSALPWRMPSGTTLRQASRPFCCSTAGVTRPWLSARTAARCSSARSAACPWSTTNRPTSCSAITAAASWTRPLPDVPPAAENCSTGALAPRRPRRSWQSSFRRPASCGWIRIPPPPRMPTKSCWQSLPGMNMTSWWALRWWPRGWISRM